MSLLQARGITKSFGARLILDGLDFDVEPGVRMGIIGPNGGGKSTLLRILTGAETADAGEITMRRGLVLAFLPQQLEGDDRNAMRTLRAARPDLDELEADLAKVAAQLAEQGADMAKLTRLLRRQEEIIERWTAAGGPGFEGRARAPRRRRPRRGRPRQADTGALGRPAKARGACGVPVARPRRAAARRAGGAPRRRGTRAHGAPDAQLRRCGGRGL